jgi:hypothetical protein
MSFTRLAAASGRRDVRVLGLVVAVELLVLALYALATPSRIARPRYALYPFVWINAGEQSASARRHGRVSVENRPGAGVDPDERIEGVPGAGDLPGRGEPVQRQHEEFDRDHETEHPHVAAGRRRGQARDRHRVTRRRSKAASPRPPRGRGSRA